HVAHGRLGRPDHAAVADPAPEPDHGRLVRLARVARPLTAGQQPLVGARPPGHAGAAALAAAGLGVGTAVPAAGLGLDLAGALDRVHEVGQPVLEVVAGGEADQEGHPAALDPVDHRAGDLLGPLLPDLAGADRAQPDPGALLDSQHERVALGRLDHQRAGRGVHQVAA